MKKLLPFAMAMALAAPAFGQEAVSDPVGYETITLQPGQFNFFGLRLTEAATASGTFESGDADSLTDDDASFEGFDASTTYVVEFEDGTSIAAPGSSFSGTTISGLGGQAAGLENENFTVRVARTLTDVFGDNNEAGLLAGDSIATADVVLLPQSDGSFEQAYYNSGIPGVVPASWQNASGQTVDPVILDTDGIIVQSRSTSEVDIVVTGAVPLQPRAFALSGGGSFNFVSSVFPAGATFGNTNLESSIQGGTSIAEADVVLLPQTDGSFQSYFFNVGIEGVIPASWQDSAGNDASGVVLTPALIIQRRGGDTAGVLNQPEFYNNL